MSGFPLGFSSTGGCPGACLPGEQVPGGRSRRWEGGEGSRASAWGTERQQEGRRPGQGSYLLRLLRALRGGLLHLSQFACLCAAAADLA